MTEEDYSTAEDDATEVDPPENLGFSGSFYTYGYKENITLPRNPALTPEQADELCNGHTPESLLKELNNLTGYHLEMSEPNMKVGLQILITGNHDLGKAYAWFRTAFTFTSSHVICMPRSRGESCPTWLAWYSGLPDISNCDSRLISVDQPGVDAVDKRESAIQDIDGELSIINPQLYHPRRLWDILANRVIPYEWHARTTRMFTLNIQTQPFKWGDSVSDPPPPLTEFDAGYAERLAKWTQEGFERCVPFAAISHSWAANLKYDLSPVNNKMWPIPLPVDIELEAVRQDLLNFRFPKDRFQMFQFWEVHAPPHEVEYCWLDILCLRQAWANSSGILLTEPAHPLWRQLEEKRLEEWAIDVPTIGSIYQRSSDILIYLNGIGRPVSLVKEDWESPYHWINRAWTLQESCSPEPALGKYGIVIHNDKAREVRDNHCSVPALGDDLPFRDTYSVSSRLPEISVTRGSCIFRLINTLARRHASNETDKIAGLLFLVAFTLPHFPIYKPGEDIESAWLRLVNKFYNSWRWLLSIHCPQASDQLFPTWRGLCDVLVNSPQPESWMKLEAGEICLTCDWDLPGSFDISSSAPLENAHPLVGIQPLTCRLLTTIGEQGQVFRTLQILPEEARGIKQDYSVTVAQWYLSPKVLPDSDEIYYLIPFLEQPGDGVSERRCSDWVIPQLERPAYFLVCGPMLDENSDRCNWDGIAFKKLGFTWIEPTGPGRKGSWEYWAYGHEREEPFWRFFDSVYTVDMVPLVKDIVDATPRAAKEKYGEEKVYTLIY